IDLSANGPRLRFTRDVASITMDTDGVENVAFRALGGAHIVTVGDLTGTDVKSVDVDLGNSAGTGDGAADPVGGAGTAGADSIAASGDAGEVRVTRLPATVAIHHAEVPNDTLEIDALAGDDAVQASGLTASAIGLIERGGPGADVLVGGDGDDQLI